MKFDKFDQFETESNSLRKKDSIKDLHLSFEGKSRHELGGPGSVSFDAFTNNIENWTSIQNLALRPESLPEITNIIKQMQNGIIINGKKTLGLLDIGKRKLNPDYYYQNLKQQSGFAAEIIGTAKENIENLANKVDVIVKRADDLPELFGKNNQYVDKVRMDSAGNILERIQVKFVGHDGESCLEKLLAKKFDKYFTDGLVDKLEIPSDYFDEIVSKDLINKEITSIQEQLNHVIKDGKTKAAETLKHKLEKCEMLKKMLERSRVSSLEAEQARLNPEAYMKKLFKNAAIKENLHAALDSAALAAALTATISTVDNLQQYFNGEISAADAFKDVVIDGTTAGAIAGGTTFITNTVSAAMSNSSHALISSMSSTLPAAVVSFGIQSYDFVSNFAQGVIDGSQLAYELGDSASMVLGGMAGAAAATGLIAASGPTAAVALSITGALVGTAVASAAYKSAVELGSKGVEVLSAKAKEMANSAVETAQQYIPEKVDTVVTALNNFASSVKLPFDLA